MFYSNFVIDLPKVFREQLDGIIAVSESDSMAYQLMEDLTGQDLALILANRDQVWNNEQTERIVEIIDGLKKHIPFQYLTGYAEFLDNRFLVSPGVLIPRGETEELVLWIKEDLKSSGCLESKIKVLDIGCGTGVIGISLAMGFPETDISCIDWHEAPLKICKSNADLHKVNVTIAKVDILNPGEYFYQRKYDIIVSNPPYVTNHQKINMSRNVLDYEPAEALFVPDDDPLLFYREIARIAKTSLNQNGSLYIEINEDLGVETKKLLSAYFKFVELRKDIHGRDRMIKASNGSE